MDKQSNSTTSPEISTLVSGTTKSEVFHRLTASELQKISIEELRAILALFAALDEAACAFLNQSRFSTTDDNYNAAGKIGDAFVDHLQWCISLIEQAVKNAIPLTERDAEVRAWTLLQRAASYSESLPRFLVAVAQLSVSVSELEGA